jgi:hypothetical protein
MTVAEAWIKVYDTETHVSPAAAHNRYVVLRFRPRLAELAPLQSCGVRKKGVTWLKIDG